MEKHGDGVERDFYVYGDFSPQEFEEIAALDRTLRQGAQELRVLRKYWILDQDKGRILPGKEQECREAYQKHREKYSPLITAYNKKYIYTIKRVTGKEKMVYGRRPPPSPLCWEDDTNGRLLRTTLMVDNARYWGAEMTEEEVLESVSRFSTLFETLKDEYENVVHMVVDDNNPRALLACLQCAKHQRPTPDNPCRFIWARSSAVHTLLDFLKWAKGTLSEEAYDSITDKLEMNILLKSAKLMLEG